jgi:uncharacterized protein DUF4375
MYLCRNCALADKRQGLLVRQFPPIISIILNQIFPRQIQILIADHMWCSLVEQSFGHSSAPPHDIEAPAINATIISFSPCPPQFEQATLEIARRRPFESRGRNALRRTEKSYRGHVRCLVILEVECEVDKGGFSHYFLNDCAESASFVVSALEHIGAPQTVNICQRAIAIAFPSGLPKRWNPSVRPPEICQTRLSAS